MKLRHVHLKNVRSFGKATDIDFSDDFNILIGPNAGGKSNLLDAILITLKTFLVTEWEVIYPDTGGLPRITPIPLFDNGKAALEPFTNDRSVQVVGLTLVATEEDISNIQAIKQYSPELKLEAQSYEVGEDLVNFTAEWDESLLEPDTELTYKFENLDMPGDAYQEGHRLNLYRQYLNSINMFRVLAKDNPDLELKPVLQYFPATRAIVPADFRVSLGAREFADLTSRAAMSTSRRNIANAALLGTYHFVKKRREIQESSKDKHWKNRFLVDPEVEIVTRLVNTLGYDWRIEVINSERSEYEIALIRKSDHMRISHTSSGEKELLNFILGLAALNTSDGLIIIDEPELHLHPTWQKKLVSVLREESRQTNNQFILSTHSPHLVNDDTLKNVLRVSQIKGRTEVIRIDASSLPEQQHTMQMVHSHNNERMFFADIVVLVEGIVDRVVIAELLKVLRTAKQHKQIIEVLEVIGKGNFKRYRQLLKQLGVTCCIVADQDYLLMVGNSSVKSLFKPALKAKHFKGGTTRDVKNLGDALAEKDLDRASDAFSRLAGRHSRMKERLTKTERQLLNSELKRLAADNVFVLSRGAIDDYLPVGFKGDALDKVLKLNLNNGLWKALGKRPTYRKELRAICKDILESD